MNILDNIMLALIIVALAVSFRIFRKWDKVSWPIASILVTVAIVGALHLIGSSFFTKILVLSLGGFVSGVGILFFHWHTSTDKQ